MATSCNRYAVCQSCIEALGHSKAVKEKFANTQKTCRSHLKQCQYFIFKYSELEREKILEI